MTRRHSTPMDHQHQAVRAELLATMARLVDDWPWVDSLAGSLHAGGGPGGSKGGHADPTGQAAMVGDEAARWLDRFRALRVEVRLMDGARAHMAPATTKEREAKRGRGNDVEVCVKCQLPAPHVKRIDGAPYHRDTCYYQEHRLRKKAAGLR